MVYLNTFKTAFLLFPIVALLITIPFIIIEYHKYGSINKLRTLIIYSFILYLMNIYFLVILPLPSIDYVKNLSTPKYQLVPFRFIIDFINGSGFIFTKPSTYLGALKSSSFYTVIFNIFMTIPFGMYLRYYFQCDLKKTIKYSFLLSLFFELTQATGLYFIYPRSYRLFDVDDLMMNTLGGIIGYFLMGKIKFLPTRTSIDLKTQKDALNVSGLRRITLFLLDLVIYTVISGLILIIMHLFNFDKYNNIGLFLTFIIYYIFIPFWKKGKTLGSNFVHVCFEFENLLLLRLIIKVLCEFGYYFYLPVNIIKWSIKVLKYFNLDVLYIFIIIFILIIIMIKVYVSNFLKLLKNGKVFYDKISGVVFVSTIN